MGRGARPQTSTRLRPRSATPAVSGLSGRPWAAYRLSPCPRRRRHAGLDHTVIARAAQLRRYGKFGPLEVRKTNRKVGRHVDRQRTRRVRGAEVIATYHFPIDALGRPGWT